MGKDLVTAIIMATMIEAKPFIQGLALNQIATKPFAVFQNKNILLIISGVGKANAAKATADCCQKFNPVGMINLGAAGATDFSHGLGEIFHIKEIYEYDGSEFDSKTLPFYKPHIMNRFKTAQLVTSDKAVLDPAERKKISINAGLVDMEGASVIQACEMFDTKCILFKFVSDTPRHTSDREIIENIKLYRTRFFEFFFNSVLPVLLP